MKQQVSGNDAIDSDADVSLDDYNAALDPDAPEPLPNANAYMGGESGEMPEPPNMADRRERFSSRIKTGWTPPDDKVAALPARGAGVPTIDEWLDFFSRVFVGTITDFAIEMAFRGIDEELLTDREIQSIKLDREERDRIARPFAEFASRNKFTRKHGREIIAMAGSVDALMQLGLWYTRMTRIAMKYRRMSGEPVRQRPFKPRGAARQHVRRQEERNTQRVIVVPPPNAEEVQDVSTGSGTPNSTANGHSREWRPDVGGPVYNPGG